MGGSALAEAAPARYDSPVRTSAVVLVSLLSLLSLAAPAGAQGPMDPGADKWSQPRPAGPGKLSVQGDPHVEGSTSTWPIPLWVSAPAALLVAAGGFALTVPQLSIAHVLGFRSGANRGLGYAGLGLLALAPAVGLGLSGGGLGTVVTGTLIEAGLVGASFGVAYLANLARSAPTSSVGVQIALNDGLGISLVAVDVAFIVGASLFPVLCAFMSGDALDQEDRRALGPIDEVGLLPTRGGAMLNVGWSIP